VLHRMIFRDDDEGVIDVIIIDPTYHVQDKFRGYRSSTFPI